MKIRSVEAFAIRVPRDIGAAAGLWPHLLEHLLAMHWFEKYWIAALILSPVVALALACWSSLALGGSRRRLRTLSHLVALLFGFLMAALIEHVAPSEYAHKFMVVLTVTIATFSGAVRYLAENFAWEAELHRYREALAMFERLKRRGRLDFSQNALSAQGEANVFDLGKLALNESESWKE